jgi:hypothetical protein
VKNSHEKGEQDSDNLWTKIEILQWVLYVIFVIRKERMVVN